MEVLTPFLETASTETTLVRLFPVQLPLSSISLLDLEVVVLRLDLSRT